MLAIGSHSLVCMEETNGNARYATTMVVSGRCPQVFDFIEVSGVAFDPPSGIMVTLNREVEGRNEDIQRAKHQRTEVYESKRTCSIPCICSSV